MDHEPGRPIGRNAQTVTRSCRYNSSSRIGSIEAPNTIKIANGTIFPEQDGGFRLAQKRQKLIIKSND
jgi:hypothetical protein